MLPVLKPPDVMARLQRHLVQTIGTPRSPLPVRSYRMMARQLVQGGPISDSYSWNQFCADPTGFAEQCMADDMCKRWGGAAALGWCGCSVGRGLMEAILPACQCRYHCRCRGNLPRAPCASAPCCAVTCACLCSPPMCRRGRNFVYVHIQPQQQCIVTEGGGWAVDFIGRVRPPFGLFAALIPERFRLKPRHTSLQTSRSSASHTCASRRRWRTSTRTWAQCCRSWSGGAHPMRRR